MQIEPGQHVGPIRSIRPVQSPQATTGATAPSKAQAADSYSFEAVYQAKLPRVPMTDAHRKLDRIRTQLVAAKTDVPIHFNDVARPASNNPYAGQYPRMIGDAGQINANLTAAHSPEGDIERSA